MRHTIIALYDDFSTAQRAVEDLVNSGFSRDSISLIANDASGSYSTSPSNDTTMKDDVSAGEGAGFGAVVGGLLGLGAMLIPGIGPVVAAGPLAAALIGGGVGAAAGAATGGITAGLIDMGVSEQDAHVYAEGVRRGGAMVSIEVGDEQRNRAEEILNRYNPVDLDHRQQSYTESGWTGYDANAQPYTSQQIETERQNYAMMGGTRTLDAGEHATLPVVEEELQIGKREVEQGGVRVRSYVTERPVQEQVTLRQEHVTVDRHPVDRPLSSAELNTFQEGVIEVTERAEQAVVNKQARVVEEVVVGKEVEQHTETIQDTVRRTDVDVEQMSGTRTGAVSGSTTFQPFETYETTFRTHYGSNFANSGYGYEYYQPAYRYGYNLATNDTYRGYTWDRVESDARRQWEQHNPNTWDQFKDSIRHAWENITGRR